MVSSLAEYMQGHQKRVAEYLISLFCKNDRNHFLVIELFLQSQCVGGLISNQTVIFLIQTVTKR